LKKLCNDLINAVMEKAFDAGANPIRINQDTEIGGVVRDG
jgi:hypothetical protein